MSKKASNVPLARSGRSAGPSSRKLDHSATTRRRAVGTAERNMLMPTNTGISGRRDSATNIAIAPERRTIRIVAAIASSALTAVTIS